MTDPDRPASDILPPGVADRVLTRAAELDAVRSAGTSVARLRETALDAGIAPDAFDAALREAGDGAAPFAPPGAPLWVRVSLLGVHERRAAMAYYWLFTAVLIATFVGALALAVLAPANLPGFTPLLLTFLLVWSTFSLWSTSRAVRWADRHGWDRLP